MRNSFFLHLALGLLSWSSQLAGAAEAQKDVPPTDARRCGVHGHCMGRDPILQKHSLVDGVAAIARRRLHR